LKNIIKGSDKAMRRKNRWRGKIQEKNKRERNSSKPIILAKIPLSEVFGNQCD
jgi:hypothetical protein